MTHKERIITETAFELMRMARLNELGYYNKPGQFSKDLRKILRELYRDAYERGQADIFKSSSSSEVFIPYTGPMPA